MSDDTTTRPTEMPRRTFIERALVGAGIVSGTAIIGSASIAMSNPTPRTVTNEHSGHTQPGADAAPQNSETMTADEIDDHHEQGVKDFLKNQATPITKGQGNVLLQPVVEAGVKVFRLTVDEVEWEVTPGKLITARGYNNMIPGPILRATEGETVRIIVKNNLKESTTVHWHGLYVPNAMDGVAFVNQPPIKPGASFTYEFQLRNSGTHMYHSHHNAMDQVNRGLLGAFIVDPKDSASYPAHDREYVLVLNDLNLGFTINGKGFPATQALTAKRGERIIVRFLNEGIMNHPMHLHGMPMQVFAKDGFPVNPPQLCDTIDVAPGNRYDVLVDVTEAGVWAFHCHVLTHAESNMGMFGLVTALVVE